MNKSRWIDFKTNWYIWLFPLFAVGITSYLFLDYFHQRGPVIHIEFPDGASIQPQKTRIKFHGVPVGEVTSVEISEDRENVVVTARLHRHVRDFAVEGTKFWLVAPKVSWQGVSGLETLIEGSYISVQPGKPDGKKTLRFKGREGTGFQDALEETTTYILETADADSITVGDAVTFRNLKVGIVSRVTLSKTSQKVLIYINVPYQYNKLIRTNTVFWKKVAVQAKLGLFKSELKIESFESLLHGGIQFFTPDPPGEKAKGQAHFDLQGGPPKDYEKWNPSL